MHIYEAESDTTPSNVMLPPLTATAKGTGNYGFHNPNPFSGTPPRHPVTGSKYGRPYEVPFGCPPGGAELACSWGAAAAIGLHGVPRGGPLDPLKFAGDLDSDGGEIALLDGPAARVSPSGAVLPGRPEPPRLNSSGLSRLRRVQAATMTGLIEVVDRVDVR
jgi:hypothetical protein